MTAAQPTITRRVLRRARGALIAIGVFSCLINLLMLTGPVYMLQVYDRVLASGSVPTLLALTLIVAVLYMFMAVLELIRGRILIRIGHKFDDDIGRQAFATYVDAPMKLGPHAEHAQPIRDVDQLRQFFSSPGITALFDMPWMPLYLGVVFLIHPYLGLLATFGALTLVTIAIITDRVARHAVKTSGEASNKRMQFADASRRNAEVVRGMGMLGGIGVTFNRLNRDFLRASARSSEIISTSSTLTKVFRLALQSAILGLGAYLAVQQAITPGAMIAASIIMSRALQPVEAAVSNWRQFLASRQAFRRLGQTLTVLADEHKMTLPAPRKSLAAKGVSVVAPGSRTPIIYDVTFRIQAGRAVGVIGRSGSGKSSLARALVGVWPTARGSVDLDDAPIEQYPPEVIGKHIGYLPQDVELFQGTVAENIARFEPTYSPDKVVAAARTAGVHERILTLPDGYNTLIGDGGATLSGGQRQRVGLARALYDDPFLVVLDEPNSNLDAEGDLALSQAMQAVKERGGIVVIVAHRPSSVQVVDYLLQMSDGRVKDYGTREEMMAKVTRSRESLRVAKQSEPAE